MPPGGAAPPILLPLLLGLVGVLVGSVLTYLFGRMGKQQDRRLEWFDAKDQQGQDQGVKLRELEWKLSEIQRCHADLQRCHEELNTVYREIQKTLSTLGHTAELHDWRLKHIEDSLEDLRQIVSQNVVDAIKARVR